MINSGLASIVAGAMMPRFTPRVELTKYHTMSIDTLREKEQEYAPKTLAGKLFGWYDTREEHHDVRAEIKRRESQNLYIPNNRYSA